MLGKTCENATDFLQNQGKCIIAYFNFYNTARFHQSLDYNVPDEIHDPEHYFCKQVFATNIIKKSRIALTIQIFDLYLMS
ncbi:hypothetical protein [Treponema succinifaciens]|uniref:hypothetical protein n=1 Tax=Treponema succinifaciens TaxID=167 RepID=UPI0005A1249B|nr:hypothetical protein [Treponema succinifaciens]